MDNAQKAIMIGVGLFITIIIISAVMLMTNAGNDMMNNGMDQLSNISDSLSRQLYSDFAGATMSGAKVISAIKNYAGSNVKIIVHSDKKDTNGKVYTSSNAGSASNKIVSTAQYTSKVTITDNVVTRIDFYKGNTVGS